MTGPLQPRKTLLIFSQPPHVSSRERDRMDLALALAAGDWPLSVAFVDAGVLMLARPGPRSEAHDFPAGLGMLAMFDVSNVWVDRNGLDRYGLSEADLRIPCQVGGPEQIRHLMEQAECLM